MALKTLCCTSTDFLSSFDCHFQFLSFSLSLSPYLPPSLPFSLLSCNFLCSRHWPRTPAPPPPKYWEPRCEPPRPVFQGFLLDSGSVHFSVSLGFLVRPLIRCEIQNRSPVQRWKEMTFMVSWLPCCVLSLQKCIGEKKWKDSEQILYSWSFQCFRACLFFM